MKFLDDSGSFDVEAFEHSVQVVTTAQDILVGASDYPTDKIAEMTAAAATSAWATRTWAPA